MLVAVPGAQGEKGQQDKPAKPAGPLHPKGKGKGKHAKAGKPPEKPPEKSEKTEPTAKPAPPKAVPPAPVDPMKQADLVTQGADRQAESERDQTELLQAHFRLCDLDGNGWISLREGTLTLALSRDEYRRADKNGDGRFDVGEFQAQKELVLTRLGARATPTASPVDPDPKAAELTAAPVETAGPPAPVGVPAAGTEAASPPPSVEPEVAGPPPAEPAAPACPLGDIREHYDVDHSDGLDATELGRFLQEIGLALSAELLVEKLDHDDSAQLETAELTPLTWLTCRNGPLQLPWVQEREAEKALPPAPVAEATPSSVPPARAPSRGPPTWTHFGRLDVDLDGDVDIGDLRILQGPERLDLRLEAVLSALDLDSDGHLSQAEFLRSMGR